MSTFDKYKAIWTTDRDNWALVIQEMLKAKMRVAESINDV